MSDPLIWKGWTAQAVMKKTGLKPGGARDRLRKAIKGQITEEQLLRKKEKRIWDQKRKNVEFEGERMSVKTFEKMQWLHRQCEASADIQDKYFPRLF